MSGKCVERLSEIYMHLFIVIVCFVLKTGINPQHSLKAETLFDWSICITRNKFYYVKNEFALTDHA